MPNNWLSYVIIAALSALAGFLFFEIQLTWRKAKILAEHKQKYSDWLKIEKEKARKGIAFEIEGHKQALVESLSDWSVLVTGTSGNVELEKAWLRAVQNMYTIFCKKQHDYGPANIAVGQLPGVVIRMGDKMSRLFELTIRKEDVTKVMNEPVTDTLYDLSDYGIIGLLVLSGDWPTVEPSEAWADHGHKTQ